MKKYIGCDLGGTNLRAAIVNVENGSIVHQMSMPTQARDGHEALMKRMAGLFLQIIEWAGLKKEDIGGIGIGVPGVLDLEKGETLFLPNLPGTWPHGVGRDRSRLRGEERWILQQRLVGTATLTDPHLVGSFRIPGKRRLRAQRA